MGYNIPEDHHGPLPSRQEAKPEPRAWEWASKVFDDWTTLQLAGDPRSFGFHRATGRVYKLPHPDCPIVPVDIAPAAPQPAILERLAAIGYRPKPLAWLKHDTPHVRVRYSAQASSGTYVVTVFADGVTALWSHRDYGAELYHAHVLDLGKAAVAAKEACQRHADGLLEAELVRRLEWRP